MDNNKTRIKHLLLQRQWTPADVQWMVAYLQQHDQHALEEIAQELFESDIQEARERLNKRLSEQLLQRIHQRIRKPRKLTWLPYAAAIIFALAVGIYVYQVSDKQLTVGNLVEADIQPGGNRATLTLADGRTIALSSEQSGIVVGDDIKYLGGIEVLEQGARSKEQGQHSPFGMENGNHNTQYAILTTPKGGTYQLTLADGTKVWLNAASTLKYPERFDDKERVVELEGEAYFEVSYQLSAVSNQLLVDGRKQAESRQPIAKKVPFLVKTATQTVEVLGTQFNISAYDDDADTKTTLVEGKVHVTADGQGAAIRNTQYAILSPGQQSIVNQENIHVNNVDVSGFIGWKSGDFVFNGTELRDAMKQLSRWYDVEVVYEGHIPRTPFYGSISRNYSLTKLLNVLKEGKVNFSIQQHGSTNRLIVKP